MDPLQGLMQPAVTEQYMVVCGWGPIGNCSGSSRQTSSLLDFSCSKLVVALVYSNSCMTGRSCAGSQSQAHPVLRLYMTWTPSQLSGSGSCPAAV